MNQIVSVGYQFGMSICKCSWCVVVERTYPRWSLSIKFFCRHCLFPICLLFSARFFLFHFVVDQMFMLITLKFLHYNKVGLLFCSCPI